MPAVTRFQIDDTLLEVVRLGVVRAEPVSVGPASPRLLDEMQRTAEDLRRLWSGRRPSEIEPLRPARELYRAFGIDPTKTRPSSESLLRRVLRDKPLPRIFNAVDVCNLLSVSSLLPMGLYDASKIEGDALLRRGRAGEAYAGIRKDEVHLEGRPALVDGRGPFGNPTSDSLRTSVDPSTTALILVIFAPPHEVSTDRMDRHVASARETIERHLAPDDVETRTLGTILGSS